MQQTKRQGKRTICDMCGTAFPKRGGKVTCSDACRSERRKTVTIDRISRRSPKQKPVNDRTSPLYIKHRSVVNAETGCWDWARSINVQTGYGQIGYPPYTAHRLSYMIFVADPGSEVVRHLCGNRRCCNPDHLTVGSHKDNYWDSREAYLAAAARQVGRVPANAVQVVVGGRVYPSKVAAMKDLRVGPKRLAQLSAT